MAQGAAGKKCGEDDKPTDFLYLSLVSGGMMMGYIATEKPVKLPEDSLRYCERVAIGMAALMSLEGISDYQTLKNMMGTCKIGDGLCPELVKEAL